MSTANDVHMAHQTHHLERIANSLERIAAALAIDVQHKTGVSLPVDPSASGPESTNDPPEPPNR